MKRLSWAWAITLAFLLTVQAFSQTDQQGGQEQPQETQGERGHGMGRRGGAGNPDQELARLTKQLNLTADEQSKIKPILENQTQEMQQLRQDTSIAQQDRFSKMRDIRQNTMSHIREVLTPDQQQKFDTMQKNRESRRHGEHNQAPPQ